MNKETKKSFSREELILNKYSNYKEIFSNDDCLSYYEKIRMIILSNIFQDLDYNRNLYGNDDNYCHLECYGLRELNCIYEQKISNEMIELIYLTIEKTKDEYEEMYLNAEKFIERKNNINKNEKDNLNKDNQIMVITSPENFICSKFRERIKTIHGFRCNLYDDLFEMNDRFCPNNCEHGDCVFFDKCLFVKKKNKNIKQNQKYYY